MLMSSTLDSPLFELHVRFIAPATILAGGVIKIGYAGFGMRY